jgi:hypothetical protein
MADDPRQPRALGPPALGRIGEAGFVSDGSVLGSVAHSTTSMSRNSRKDIVQKRQELRRHIAEGKLLKKLNEVAQSQLRVVEATFLDLKDTLEAKTRSAHKNTLLLDKLSLTNRMLIKTLNSLELKADMVDGFVASQTKGKGGAGGSGSGAGGDRTTASAAMMLDPTADGTAATAAGGGGPGGLGGGGGSGAGGPALTSDMMTNKNNDTYLQNFRLKESLLNITRDHFRAVDATIRMATGMEDLKVALRQAQVKNKQLLIDLAELRNEEVVDGGDKHGNEAGEGQEKRTFGALDERMLALVEGGDVDPFDTILQVPVGPPLLLAPI